VSVKSSTTKALRISTLRPYEMDLGGRHLMVVCTGCGSWLTVVGKTLPVHRSDNRPDQRHRDHEAPRRPRCTQSGRPVVVNLSPAVWSERMRAAIGKAGTRRGSRTVRDAHIPAPTPLHRIAGAR
jgi:hypothetical protein